MTADDGAWRKTACILCECNCGLEVQVTGRELTRIRGDREHPGSAGYTCEKPLRLDRYQNGPHRLDTPLRRRPDGSYEEIGWDTALDEIAARLAAVRDTHGGESIFYYGGGGQGNHLGGSHGRALQAALGVRYASNALAQEKTSEGWVDLQLHGNHTTGDFENCEVAVFIGKNPWQSHGVARARPVLREIARDPARTMIVVDPRRSETAGLADLHLQLRPGTDAWCMSAIAATLVQEDLIAHDWLARHATGVDAVVAALSLIDIAGHAGHCGVPEELIRTAARRIAAAGSVATYEDLGVQHSSNSTLVAYLNKMLWLLTGNFAKPGGQHIHSWMFPIAGRWHPVPPQAGVGPAAGLRRRIGRAAMRRGAPALRRVLRSAPDRLRPLAERAAAGVLRAFFDPVAVPVARPIADAVGRFEHDGTTPVTGARMLYGLIPCSSIADEILTDHPGRFRAMWVDGSNPAHSLPGSERFARAMRSLDVSVVVDVAFTETARQADYVLPASSQFEKYEASMFTLHFPHNTFQLRRPLMDPLPGTRPEAEIYAQVVDRLGVVEPGCSTTSPPPPGPGGPRSHWPCSPPSSNGPSWRACCRTCCTARSARRCPPGPSPPRWSGGSPSSARSPSRTRSPGPGSTRRASSAGSSCSRRSSTGRRACCSAATGTTTPGTTSSTRTGASTPRSPSCSTSSPGSPPSPPRTPTPSSPSCSPPVSGAPSPPT